MRLTLYGECGRGLTVPYQSRDNVLVVHACGKALGACGALVATARVLRDFMINRCRPFVFATAPSPLMAVAVREALLILQQEPERQQRLANLVAFTKREIRCAGFGALRTRRSCPISLATTRLQCGWPLHCRLAASISAEFGRQPCRRVRPVCEFH